MKDKLQGIKDGAEAELREATSLHRLEEIRIKFLGKKGELTQAMKGMGALSKEERPRAGQLANETRAFIESTISEKKEALIRKEQEEKVLEETLDVTMEWGGRSLGHRHPLNSTKEELENLFLSMGFSIVDGPEIETVENNFDLLNAPKHHPSRDWSDTFYISDEILLRTQTSPVQIRVMKSQKPPIKMVSAGKTFRFDDVDDTHSPMFHQIEGLVVDEHITMANLIETIDVFVRELFGTDMKTRFRPHYFPFTEPSAEVDVTCFQCRGAGCDGCNYTGWSMELLGCGMVHPNVLSACGIDPQRYSGFAFGMGVDRIAMVKHGIGNIRLLYENDQRFLAQF